LHQGQSISLTSSSICPTHHPPQAYKKSLIQTAAAQLKTSQMAVYDERSGNLYVTELGRVASHYYIRHGGLLVVPGVVVVAVVGWAGWPRTTTYATVGVGHGG
jgi:hypothetical protein